MKTKMLLAAAALTSLMASAPSTLSAEGFGGCLVRVTNDAPTAADLIAELNQGFNAFKEANELRMKALEDGKGTSEVDAKIEKIEETMNNAEKALLALQTQNGIGGNAAPSRVVDQNYTDSFNQMLRLDGDRAVPEVVNDALTKTTESGGGYVVPSEWDRTIQDDLVEISAIRQIVTVQTVTGGGFKKLVNLKGTAAGWVGETDARPQTDASSLAELGIGWGELYAMPAASQNILDDASIDMEAWISSEVREAFALKENPAFIGGNGDKKPRGLLTYVAGGANADRHPLGPIGTIASGDAAGITSDAIIDMVYAGAMKYREGSRFAMNRLTLSAARKLTDGDGNYLWQPTFAAGQPSTMAGYAVSEIEDMPDLAAGSYPIAFGNFKKAYTIFDRQGVTLLRDPYTAKPYVLFYMTKRVGGACMDPHAMKVMQIG